MSGYTLPDIEDKTIVVWFSCGIASAAATKETLAHYGENNTIRVVNTPILEEHPDNQRFRKDVEAWIQHPIETCINPKWPNSSCYEVWDARKFMSSPWGAPCTLELKKKARQHWETNNSWDYLVLGFTAEETKRFDQFRKSERDNILPILIAQGITRENCQKIVEAAGIRLPEMYRLGYPNANCIGCVKATSATYWNLVRTTHPQVFEERMLQSREIGCKLTYYKGERLFLDELPPDAKGHDLKSLRIECGIFCEYQDEEK